MPPILALIEGATPVDTLTHQELLLGEREAALSPCFGFFQIMKLEIDEIAAPRSFIFLWCGSGEGLDLGRVVSRAS